MKYILFKQVEIPHSLKNTAAYSERTLARMHARTHTHTHTYTYTHARARAHADLKRCGFKDCFKEDADGE